MAKGATDGGRYLEFVGVILDVGRASFVCDGRGSVATCCFSGGKDYITVWALVGKDKLVEGEMVLGMGGVGFGRVEVGG